MIVMRWSFLFSMVWAASRCGMGGLFVSGLQKPAHLCVDQVFLGDKAVVMSVGDLDDLCVRKGLLRPGDQRLEKGLPDVLKEFIEGGLLCLRVGGQIAFAQRIKSESRDTAGECR